MRFLGGSFLSTLFISIVFSMNIYGSSYAACQQDDENIFSPSILQLADNANVIVVAEVVAIENNTVSANVSQYLKGGGELARFFHKPMNAPCDENLVVGAERIIFTSATKDKQGLFILGKTASATERNIHLLVLNESQNDFLHKKSCAAVYDGAHLTVPCVKTIGSEVITQADLQQIGEELSFNLTRTMPYYILTAPSIGVDSADNLVPNYAAIDSVEVQFLADPVHIFALVTGHFTNGCEYFKPKPATEVRVNKKNIFPLFLTVSKPYAGQQCNEIQRPFSLKIELLTNDLPTGEYVLRVNDSHTQTFSF